MATTMPQWLQDLITLIDKNDYLMWHHDIRVISVFDDIKYDRSDIDILSPAMRKFAVNIFKEFDCQQSRGTRIDTPTKGLRIWLPKPSVLGASPFDITHHHTREKQDIYLLTPTQTAAYWFDHEPLQQAVDNIAEMVKQQPINLLKLSDMLHNKPERQDILQAFGYLRYCQRIAIEQPSMRFKRSLGSVF